MIKQCERTGCGVNYEAPQKRRKFCSHACYGASLVRRRVRNKCAYSLCRIEFDTTVKGAHKFCGKVCADAHMSDERTGQKRVAPLSPKWFEVRRSSLFRQKMSVAHKGKRETHECSRRGSVLRSNVRCFMVSSPARRIYQVHNIAEFVRKHRRLFSTMDLTSNPGSPLSCKAVRGLGSLVRKVETRGSWKGWTLVSVQK